MVCEEPFMKLGLNFNGPIKPSGQFIENEYIHVDTNHATKWVEVKSLYTNIITITTKFMDKFILTRFG